MTPVDPFRTGSGITFMPPASGMVCDGVSGNTDLARFLMLITTG